MSYSSIADYEERLKEVDERSESNEVVPYDIPQTIKKIERPQGMGDRGVDGNDRPIWARTKVSGDKPQTAVEKGTTLQYRIVRNGVEEAYEVPEHLQEKFERKYPDARIAYTAAGNNYLVPIWKREKFFKEYPDATAHLSPRLRHTGESAKGKALREQPDWPMASDTDMRRSLQESIAAVGKSLEERYDVLDKERADAEARQTGLGGFFYGAAQARRASLGMPDTFNPVYDKEYRQLTAANNLLGDTKELVEAVDNDGTFAGNALRGMRDGLFDPDTWTAGLLEMTDQVELLQAVEKAEKGERLTDAESALLDASALNYLINASYADQLSRGYKAGKVTAESLPFMLEMASNPASGIGRGLGGRIARAALKRGTSRFLGKAASWAGRAVGDVAGAAAMAATTGAARVGSDAVSRYIGSPDYDIDDDGNITFAGTHGGEDTWLSAFGKAFASTTIENHSEMAGEYFAPVGRLAKRATGWIPGFKQARRFIDETGKGRIGTALKEFKRMTRWDGTMGEFAEEIIGGMENALIVGDQTLDAAEGTGVFSKDNLIDTFLGVALMGGFFGGAQITGYRNPRKRIRDKLDAAGRNGEHVFGVEGWQPVSQLAEGFIASGTGMNTKRFRDFMSTMPKDQRMATIDYMGAIAEARGYANARAKTESEAASNPESEAAMSERLRKAYDTGSAYGGDISVLHTAWRNMGAVRSRLTEDELAMNDDDLAAYAMEPGNVARRKDITDYLESKNILQGGRDRFDDDAKAALEEKRKAFAELANKDTGFVTLVETKEEGERAYVTAGALSADKDGNILSGGNSIAIVDENGGNKRMVADSGISKVLSMEDEAAYTAQERAALENAGQVYESMVSAPTMEELEASVRLGEETFLRTPEGATVKVDDVTGIDSSGNVVYVENVAGKKVPKMMPLADFVSMQEAYVRSHAGDGRNAEENEPQRPADAQGVSGTSRQPEASSDIQVPRDKDGNVMYDELLASNPREYARLYTEEFGEEAAREDMLSQLQSIDDEIEKRKNKISSSTSSDTKAKARREISVLEGRRDALSGIINGDKGDGKMGESRLSEEQAEDAEHSRAVEEAAALRRAEGEKLTKDEALTIIDDMEERAETAPEMDLTIENWDAEFGEDGIVNTPIGEVKMGENQFVKLMRKGRNGKLGMIKPTLETPDIIIEDNHENKDGVTAERDSSYVFVKAFTKSDGSRYYYFTSITVSQEGKEVVVSNQEKSRNRVLRLMLEGSVIWRTPKDATTSSAEKQGLDYAHPNEAEDATKGSGITPQSTSSVHKDKTNPAQGQASEGKSSTAAPVFEDMPVNDAVAMIDESLGGDAAAFISDNIAQARKRLDKAERRRPKSTDFNQRIVENMEIESERREARRVLDAWNAMSERLSAVKAEMELERQRLDDISAGRDEVTESIRNDIEPQDMEELAAWVLSDRNIRITPESYYSETGYSPSDRRRLVGKFARKENGGMSVSEIGEMVESEALSRGWTGYDDTAGNDANAGRNAVLSVLNSVETVGDINNYISRKRKEHAEMLERENRNRLDALAYERGFANFDEMLEYDEWLQGEARRVLTSEDYNNYLNLLNEENSEGRHGTEGNGTQEGGVEGYNAGDGQGNIENEQGTVQGGRHEGSGLLQEERPGASVGTGESDGHASSVGNDTDETAHEDNGTPEIRLSNEIDANGRQFVLTSEGQLAFGEITEKSGLTPAPILLSEGMITNPATNDGYGLVHIEARHGDQIRKAGYKSVPEFIEDVAKNYERIKEGNLRNGNQTYLIQLTDRRNNTLIVELSSDGVYWNINTAGIFKETYGKNRRVVYDRHTTDTQSAETAGASREAAQSGTTASPSMNAPTTTVSYGHKGNENNRENQTGIFEAAEQAAQKVQEERDIAEGKLPGTLSDSRSIAEKTEKIEDYGEKIGGAKKDRVKEAAKKLEEADKNPTDVLSDLRNLPASKMFNFDYAALRNDGVSNEIVTLLQCIRKIIPSKPRTEWKLKRWAEQTFALYRFCLELIASESDIQNEFINKIQEIGRIREMYNASMALGGYDGGVDVGMAGLSQLRNGSGYFDKEDRFVSTEGQWYLSNAGRYGGRYETYEKAKEALSNFAGKAKEDNSERKSPGFTVYGFKNRNDEFFIAPKGKPQIVLQNGFKTVREAHDYLMEHSDELSERLAGLKKGLGISFKPNAPRKGKDWRDGKDVTVKDFADTFGFRGVEFGNWTDQQERQSALNEAYDAFMDLSEAVGISPRGLSLNGELGMAFGARGGSAAAAHYETNKVVINLTKTKGAGTLAHEWWHALDNYFARRRGDRSGFNTETSKVRYKFTRDGDGRTRISSRYRDGEREEITMAFHGIMDAIAKSGYGRRSSNYARLKSNYWKEPTELGARAFAFYVEHKLADKGIENGFLANNYPEGWEDYELTVKYYPYPLQEDYDALDKAFDGLFSAIQEETDPETGNVALYDVRNALEPERMDEDRMAAYDAVVSMLGKAGIPVETLSNEQMEQMRGGVGITSQAFDNMVHGLQALEEISEGKDEVRNAMRRDDISEYGGDNEITFVWGTPGEPEKNYKGGSGISHIAAKHGSSTLLKMLDVIANGQVSRHVEGNKTLILEKDGYEAVLALTRFGNRESWLLTGWEKNEKTTGGNGEVSTTSVPTQISPTFSRADLGAVVSDAKIRINPVNPRLMTVYHGSGADFDRFDHSFMGMGEGAQAYGWGSYVTEVKGIGRTYARENASGNLFVSGFGDFYLKKLREAISEGRNFTEEKNNLLKWHAELYKSTEKDPDSYSDFRHDYELLSSLQKSDVPQSHLYTVEIPDDTGKNYLKWEEDVPGALDKKRIGDFTLAAVLSKEEKDDTEREMLSNDIRDSIEDTRTGKDLYKAISLYLGDKEASSLLHDIGFTGISYPAQYTTGGRKDGARNYVIFDENDLKITDHIRFLQDGKGVVYGATVGGRIYINAERINPETPIHEYTHIWDDACRRNNPELWKRGVELMKGTSVWQDVVNDGNYSDLRTDDEIAGEVHARLTGRDGAALMERLAREARESGGIAEAAERISAVSRLKKWLSDFWYWLKDTMAPWTRKEASRVGLEDFVNMPLKDLAQGTMLNDAGRDIDEVNARFNEQLSQLNENNSNSTILSLGMPNEILVSVGMPYRKIALYGNKLIKKSKEHGFDIQEVKDLPLHVSSPIAIFRGSYDDSYAILANLDLKGEKTLVTIDVRKGEVQDLNLVTSVFGKKSKGVVNWINNGRLLYADREKTLDYLSSSAPIADATNNQELISATNIVENFKNPKIPERKPLDSIANRTENTDITDIDGKGLYHIDESPVKTGVSGQIEGKKSVAGLAEKLGAKVDFIDSGIPEGLSGKKGAYNARTGEITIIVPNHEDAADMEETLLHEAVGHNGLRSVFGDDFDSFLSEVYRNANPEQRRGMVMNAREYGITRPGARNMGVEEYLADMAETTDFDNAARKLWDFVVSGLRGLARRLGFGVRLGDAEIRYMLRTSYDNLVAGNTPIEREARRAVLERRLGLNVGHMTDTRLPVPEETAHVSMDDISDLFDEELQMQIEGNLPKGHIYQLGRPGDLLLSTGFPDLPIELSSTRLEEKSRQENHPFDIGEINGLVKAINDPVAVFKYGDGEKSQNVIVELSSNGKNFLVGVHFNRTKKGIEINDIRGIFPKDTAEWLNWVSQGKLLYANKKKIQDLITQQRINLAEVSYLDLDSIANIIENFENPKLPDENADLRFRSKEKAMKKNADDFSTWTSEQASYNDRVNSAAAKFSEQYMDYMKSVGILQEELAKKMGRELYEFEDVWTAENQRSAKNKSEMDFFRDRYFKPLCLAAAQFMDATKISHEDLTKYQFAKHGLERNRVFAERDGITEKRDYSGITALFGVEDVRDAERQAAEFVEEVERRAGKDMTDMLWEATNKATKQTLLKQYRSGMMSRSTYEKVRDMFRYYVPMRGFEEETAEDVFDYVFSSGHRYEKPVQKAHGRRSVADNPLAYIMQMAYGAIVQGNNNMVKQRLYNLALNADSPLLTISNVWLVKNEGTDEWTEALPEIGRNDSPETIAAKLEEFENRMKSLEKEDKARRGRSGVDMPLRTVDRQADEHTVYVRMGDRRYAVFVNGDPRAAQAINGLLNPDREETMNFIRRANRWLAANFTTRSPKFIIRNMIRDSLYAATAVSIKEDGKYFKGFMKNLGKNYGRMWGLIKKYQDGTLDEKDDIERYMKEFIMNGGETGYTALMRLEDYKRMTDRLIGRANKGRLMKIADGEKGFLALIDYANRCAEDMARFAVYVTSRESGRSVERSISDAKNVSVNFNTKGAGRKYGANFFRTFYLFFNAGVQGLSNFVSLAKKNPKKFSVAMSVIFLSGVVVPMLNALISDAIGGDDDEYLDLPDWVRRNNIVIGGGGFYLTIPLGIEMRALYGMGGIIYDWSAGRMKHKNVGLEMLEQVASMLPLDISAGGDGWGGVVEALTPDLLAPIMQVVRNRDFTGKPIYRNYDYNKLYPGHTKAYAGTNKALVKSTELLNDITGGDLATRGAINLNPAVIEHLVQGYFGGALTFWNEVSKTVSMAWDEDARELNNVPILNVFLQHNGERTASSYDNDVFYHYKDEADETEIRLREYRRNGMVDEYVDLARSGEYMRYMLMKSYEKRLKSVRNAYKNDPERMNEESGRIRKEAAEMLLEYDN